MKPITLWVPGTATGWHAVIEWMDWKKENGFQNIWTSKLVLCKCIAEQEFTHISVHKEAHTKKEFKYLHPSLMRKSISVFRLGNY